MLEKLAGPGQTSPTFSNFSPILSKEVIEGSPLSPALFTLVSSLSAVLDLSLESFRLKECGKNQFEGSNSNSKKCLRKIISNGIATINCTLHNGVEIREAECPIDNLSSLLNNS